MEADLTPPVPDDALAFAGVIVVHARKFCGSADYLRRVFSELSMPTEPLTDHRQTASVKLDTEPMARVYIYQTVYDLAQSEAADRLQNCPSLLKGFGLDQPPSRQNISYAWRQFSHCTNITLEAAARGIAIEARDHDVISEALIPMELDESQDDLGDDADADSPVSRAHVCEHGSKVVELARRHGFGEFASHRAENMVYENEQILDLFSNACLTRGSAHSEGEAEWFLDENDICDDSTFLRVIEQFTTPENEKAPASVRELEIENIVAFTELYREELMKAFETATESILTTTRHEEPFDDRHVVAAVDFTHVPYHVWPWSDKDE